jgi:hypothetical protein
VTNGKVAFVISVNGPRKIAGKYELTALGTVRITRGVAKQYLRILPKENTINPKK